MPRERFAKIPDSVITASTCQSLKSSVWLLIYFYRHADWNRNILYRKDATISKDLGVSTKTVSRWRQQLKKAGLLEHKFTGRFFSYCLTGQNGGARADRFVRNESTSASTPNINTPNNETPSIYTEREENLAYKIAEWGVNRARRPSYKTEEEYAQMLLPYIRRLGYDEVFDLFTDEEDNPTFWNNLKEASREVLEGT